MRARVITSPVHPARLAEIVQLYHASVLPVTEQQPGFAGSLLLTDTESGTLLAITLWETDAAERASRTGGYLHEQIARHVDVLGVGPLADLPMTVATYEVSSPVAALERAGAHEDAALLRAGLRLLPDA